MVRVDGKGGEINEMKSLSRLLLSHSNFNYTVVTDNVFFFILILNMRLMMFDYSSLTCNHDPFVLF